MTTLSRIARIARIPQLNRKKRDSDARQKKREEDQNEPEGKSFAELMPVRCASSLIKKPRTTRSREERMGKSESTTKSNVGGKVDLTI